jgi:hypothetical protein
MLHVIRDTIMLLMYLLERLQSFSKVMERKLENHKILLYIVSMVIAYSAFLIAILSIHAYAIFFYFLLASLGGILLFFISRQRIRQMTLNRNMSLWQGLTNIACTLDLRM